MKKRNYNWKHFLIYIISVVLLSLIVGKIVNYFSTPKRLDISERIAQRPLDIVFGSDSAALTVYMYSSYSCSFCNLFFTEAYPEFKKEFIDNGEVKLIMRLTVKTNNIDLLNSLKTAVCINRYGNFEYLHQLLINNHKVVYTPDFRGMVDEFIDKDIIVAECIMGGEADEYLIQNVKDFDSFGLKGTPTFIIGNKIYAGYKDYNSFRSIILDNLLELD